MLDNNILFSCGELLKKKVHGLCYEFWRSQINTYSWEKQSFKVWINQEKSMSSGGKNSCFNFMKTQLMRENDFTS